MFVLYDNDENKLKSTHESMFLSNVHGFATMSAVFLESRGVSLADINY
jgi:hypothetical protein